MQSFHLFEQKTIINKNRNVASCQSLIWRTAFANAIVCSSPECLAGSSDSLTTGVQGSDSGSASVILITMFRGFGPTSLVKLVPMPKDIPIFPLQKSAMRLTFSGFRLSEKIMVFDKVSLTID